MERCVAVFLKGLKEEEDTSLSLSSPRERLVWAGLLIPSHRLYRYHFLRRTRLRLSLFIQGSNQRCLPWYQVPKFFIWSRGIRPSTHKMKISSFLTCVSHSLRLSTVSNHIFGRRREIFTSLLTATAIPCISFWFRLHLPLLHSYIPL